MAKKKSRQNGRQNDSAVAGEILDSLQEFAGDLRHLNGSDLKAKYRHRTVKVAARSIVYDAKAVKKLRQSMDCSQKVFADFIGVSAGTLRNWEQGIRPVSGVAARLFDEMRLNPFYWRLRLSQSLEPREAV